jgi:hypothetical protein
MSSRAHWQEQKEILEREREHVLEEIRSYPTPIPACDEQFNWLLAERTRVARELEQVNVRLGTGDGSR